MTSAGYVAQPNAEEIPELQAPEPLAHLRSHRLLHCSVIVVGASFILFLYYGYVFGRYHPSWSYLDWFWNWISFELSIRLRGLLMIIPMVYATFGLKRAHSVVAIALLLIAIGPYVLFFSLDSLTALTSTIVFVTPSMLLIGFETRCIIHTKNHVAREERKKQRTEIMRQIFVDQEAERTRVSREAAAAEAARCLLCDCAACSDGCELSGAFRKMRRHRRNSSWRCLWSVCLRAGLGVWDNATPQPPHGDLTVLPAYLALLIINALRFNPFHSIPITMLIMFVFGYLLQRGLLNFVIGRGDSGGILLVLN